MAVVAEQRTGEQPAVGRPGKPGKVRARRVRRVVRRIDPWTVLKVSVLFYLCMLVVLLVAGIVLWMVARGTGVIDNVEDFISELFLLEDFRFLPGQILRASALGGLILVILGSGANVLMAVLYNLISDVVGGVEVAVLEEEPPGPARPIV